MARSTRRRPGGDLPDLFGAWLEESPTPTSPASPAREPKRPASRAALPVPPAPAAESKRPEGSTSARTRDPAPGPRGAVVGEQPTVAAQRAVLSVGELTRQLKGVIERSFTRVLVRGEISGFRGANAKGHLYFSLKDSEACIDAKVWVSTARRLRFEPRDGLSVVVEGSVDVYAPAGRYSLIVQKLDPVGEGALALAFAQLKDKLAREGLIGPRRLRSPRPLPVVPRRIGVVTSRSGAALQDFLRVVDNRNPRSSVLLCHARMQGEGAGDEIVEAIGRLSRTDVDVIVVTRGGGSVEDLWAFNEERVARAIHACPVPVVSAVGHEIDFTIADFVADVRSPTPSAAAERIVPRLADLQLALQTARSRLTQAAERQRLWRRERLTRLSGRLADPRRLLGQRRMHLSELTERLSRAERRRLRGLGEVRRALAERLLRVEPRARLKQVRDRLKGLERRLAAASPRGELVRGRQLFGRGGAELAAAARKGLSGRRLRLAELTARLDAMSPLKVMARGYAVVFSESSGHVVRAARSVAVDDVVRIQLAASGCGSLSECDRIEARVIAVEPGSPRSGRADGGPDPADPSA